MQTTIYYIYKPYPHYMHITTNIYIINTYPHIPILHIYTKYFLSIIIMISQFAKFIFMIDKIHVIYANSEDKY